LSHISTPESHETPFERVFDGHVRLHLAQQTCYSTPSPIILTSLPSFFGDERSLPTHLSSAKTNYRCVAEMETHLCSPCYSDAHLQSRSLDEALVYRVALTQGDSGPGKKGRLSMGLKPFSHCHMVTPLSTAKTSISYRRRQTMIKKKKKTYERATPVRQA
jgi:hypothetical protein